MQVQNKKTYFTGSLIPEIIFTIHYNTASLHEWLSEDESVEEAMRRDKGGDGCTGMGVCVLPCTLPVL